jgi:D-amino-acid dehydrogenase
MSMMKTGDVVVIGGGVIGVSTAYYLAKKGRRVVLIEKGEICSGCSYGNACLITPSHCVPIPAPGVVKQALKWMWKENSPLLIRPRFDWQLFSWLIRFAAACRQAPMSRAIPVLRDLCRASRQLFEELISFEKVAFDYERRGLLFVYTTEAGLAKGRHEAELLAYNQVDVAVLDGKKVRELEPALLESVIGAIYSKEDAHGDSYRFVVGMGEVIRKLGVTVCTNTTATGILTNAASPVIVRTDRGDFEGRDIVIATGSWSPQLARGLPVQIPLQPGKGYSVTMDRPLVCPQIPVINMERRVAITPIGNRLRFAGTMELAGLDLRLNEVRAAAVLRGGLEVIAGTGTPRNVEQWCGLRPCTPDGLPIIDRIPAHPHVYVCTGHAMLGYTLGPISGKLLAEMITEGRTSMPTGALRIDRF